MMAQVLKSEVRERIQASALQHFADRGYGGATLAQIAADAGTAPANLYRYFPSKEALFAAVVPAQFAARHDALLDTRITALARGEHGPAARELLDFWLDHRLAVVILLERAEGTQFADYPAGFVRRMVEHVERMQHLEPTPAQHAILNLVFDNTRRIIARILHTAPDRDEAAALIEAFWSYQLPGLDGLITHLRSQP
jgi:AcrR family transcriptional regulator